MCSSTILTECVVVFAPEERLRERAIVLRHKYITYLVLLKIKFL